ncbi:hypothetical protein OTU49_007243, partial [Cherax quadricarinatus]
NTETIDMCENGETTLCENRMLRQKIEDGSNGTLCIYDDSIIFSPPLYCQRYVKVMEMIISVSKGVFTKVVDIGCAGLKFFRYLKNVPGIQEILLLDKDFHILKDNEYRIKPLPADFLILRKLPLNVKAVCGDGRKYDPLLSETQVVTMIELCQGILQDNSDYSLETFGCGLGPENTYCTQMAVFLRSTSRQEDLFSCILKDDMTSDTFCHRLVVGDKCFETSGDGDEWQGKLQLWEESFSSDEYEDTEAKDQERWFTDAQSSSLDKTDYDDSDNIKTTVHLNEDWG